MSYIALSVAAKFVFLFVLLVSAALFARWLHRKIPDGKLKAILYKRLP
jgi:hypothetical protein